MLRNHQQQRRPLFTYSCLIVGVSTGPPITNAIWTLGAHGSFQSPVESHSFAIDSVVVNRDTRLDPTMVHRQAGSLRTSDPWRYPLPPVHSEVVPMPDLGGLLDCLYVVLDDEPPAVIGTVHYIPCCTALADPKRNSTVCSANFGRRPLR